MAGSPLSPQTPVLMTDKMLAHWQTATPDERAVIRDNIKKRRIIQDLQASLVVVDYDPAFDTMILGPATAQDLENVV